MIQETKTFLHQTIHSLYQHIQIMLILTDAFTDTIIHQISYQPVPTYFVSITDTYFAFYSQCHKCIYNDSLMKNQHDRYMIQKNSLSQQQICKDCINSSNQRYYLLTHLLIHKIFKFRIKIL